MLKSFRAPGGLKEHNMIFICDCNMTEILHVNSRFNMRWTLWTITDEQSLLGMSGGGRVSVTLPVLGEDEELFWIVELLQNIGEELTPPVFTSTKLHQQQTRVETNLRGSANAEMFKEFLTGLGIEGALEYSGHRIAWKCTQRKTAG